MSARLLTSCGVLLAVMAVGSLAPVPVAGQARSTAAAAAKKTWTTPRTPDGAPDLQGMWTNATITPFERPRALADTPFLTEQEAAALERQSAARREENDSHPRPGDVGSYNEVWFDAGTKVVGTRRTSLVTDPPDGRVPLKPEAEAARDRNLTNEDSYEFMSPWDRCITRGPGRMFPAGYNNAYQIVQTPGYVVIHHEMIHEARIIPVDGRPHLGANLRSWTGDPRGPLGRQHPGRRDDQLQRPRLDRDQRRVRADQGRAAQRGAAPRRTLHARRRGHHDLRGHDRGSERVYAAVDGGDSAEPGSVVPDIRVRVPRGQQGGRARARRGPGSGEACGRRHQAEVVVERSMRIGLEARASRGTARIILGTWLQLRYSTLPQPTRFTVTSPPGVVLSFPRMSPDGRTMAFVGTAATRNRTSIWVRSLDSLDVRELEGTEGEPRPFWSPDSRYLAFFASRAQLKKVAVAGGPPQLVTSHAGGSDGSWSSQEVILFDGGPADPIWRVPAGGGTVTVAMEAGLPVGRPIAAASVFC